MENTGTWNLDLIIIFAACFFTPILISSIYNIYYRLQNIGAGHYTKSWFDDHDVIGFPKKNESLAARNDVQHQTFSPKPRSPSNTPTNIHNEKPPKPIDVSAPIIQRKPISKEDAWDRIQDIAIQQALEGSASARTWVTNNVYNETEGGGNAPKDPIAEDAIDALISLGFKKGEARSRVEALTANQNYTSVDVLIIDSFKN